MSTDWNEVFGGPDSLVSALWLAAAVFASAFVRGFSGFGSSALLVSAGSLVLSPRVVVPLSLALEIVASLHMLAWVWRTVAWRTLGLLCLGMSFTAPLGITALAYAPVDVLRAVIALVILMASMASMASMALWRGMRFTAVGPVTMTSVGAGSGLANGFGAVGGLPVVAYLLGIGMSGAMLRATLVAYLLIADLYASTLAGAFGIYDQRLFWLILISIPILALGVWL